MNEEQPAKPKRVYIRNGLIAFAALFVFFFLFGPLYSQAAIISIFTLIAGWLPAAGRLVASLAPSALTLVLFALGVVVSLLLAHHLATWLARRASPQSEQPTRWSVRGTTILVSGTALILFAGMSIVGAVHQVTWAFTSGEEMFADSSARGMRATQLIMSARTAAFYGELDPGATVVQIEQWRLKQRFHEPEAHRVSYIPGRDGKITGIIVLRHPAGPWDFKREFLASGGDQLQSYDAGDLQATVNQLSQSSRSPAGVDDQTTPP